MNSSAEVLLKLLRIALGTDKDLTLPSDVKWREVVNVAFSQEIAAFAYDGVQVLYDKCPELVVALDSPELENDKYEWFAESLRCESDYKHHKKVLGTLVSYLSENGISTLVLKGLGLSHYYPVPEHRRFDDIDIYVFGKGEIVDKLISEKYHKKINDIQDKHSSFRFHGVDVENHACFVNDTVYYSLRNLESFLEADALTSRMEKTVEGNIYYVPSVISTALFLPLHLGVHFFRGEASLRQICDWACFVLLNGNAIDWATVERMSKEAGYFPFLCCLNEIVASHFGVDVQLLPDWPQNHSLSDAILNDIIKRDNKRGLVYSYLSRLWKYHLVYNDNIIASSVRLAKSYLRKMYRLDRQSIWVKH